MTYDSLFSPISPSPLLRRHLKAFDSRFGLLRLRIWFHLHRIVWRCIVCGTDAARRSLDAFFSGVVLLLLSPLFLAVAALIVLEDNGPVFFAQTRVGRFGREFRMYKFRSMRTDAEKRLAECLAANQHQNGVTFKMKQDPRVTRVGRLLRRWSLDELPQFYNILIGDMSVVGPRPPVPREVALYTLADRRRLAVKPGLTCLWQISGRAEIDFSGQVGLDVNYIENQSLIRDLWIMARTLPAVISGSGAY